MLLVSYATIHPIMAMMVWMIRSFLFSAFFWLVTRSGRRSRDVGVKEELSLEKVQNRQTKQELLWSICGAELLALLALLARAPGLTLTRWVKFRLLSCLF